MNLLAKHCVPCEGDEKPFTKTQTKAYLKQVPGWELEDDGKKIERKFKLKNFKQALVFVNKVAKIAESEGHHPDIEFGWGYVEIELWTHAIGGLSENDFIMAAKIDLLEKPK